MAGYSFENNMSNNAVQAYRNGIKPISKFSIADLRSAGWPHAMKLAKTLAAAGVWKSFEYHHSSSWYNKTRFFDPTDLVAAWAELPEDIKSEYQEPKSQAKPGVRVTGSYTLWGGNRRHPRNLGQENFSGLLENGWIHLDNGGKKKASGNHITFEMEN
tara:strand:- start:1703 stop:2176 length:474 start_codon:yes stop_codon:yes gene_type:complete